MSDFALIGAVRRVHDKLPPWVPNIIAGYLFAAIAILIIPSPLNHFSTLDPITYQSYIHDYKYMVDIYGYTYYASRVAWIFPSALLQHTFGDQAGYLIIRIVLFGGSASALSILVDRLFRRPYGLYAAAWMVFSPTLLREMGHEYGDGAAFSYTFMGLACILSPKEKAGVAHFFGGVLLGLAFNTYPTSAVVPIMAVPAWLYLRRSVGLKADLICVGSAIAGFAAIYLVIAAYLWSVFTAAGQNFEIIPLSAMKELSSGGAAVWYVPLKDIFIARGDWSRAYPLFVFVAVVLFLATKPRLASSPALDHERDGLVVAAVLCGAAVLLYLGLHFGFHSGAIVYPWTYDYVLPGCALGSIGLVSAVSPRRYDPWVVSIGAGLLMAPLLFGVLNGGLPYVAPAIWLMIGVAMSLTVLLVRVVNGRVARISLVAASTFMVFPLTFYSSAGLGSCGYRSEVPGGRWVRPAPSYAACLFRPHGRPLEHDLRAGILALMDDVKSVDPGHDPGLWYANGNGFGDEVGSAYLWQYSRIASTTAGDPGMPNLDSYAKSRIAKYNTLVLVGASQQEIDLAKQALEKGGYNLTLRSQKRVGGPNFSFNYAILYKEPIDPNLYVKGPPLSLLSPTAQNGSEVVLKVDGLHVTTPAQIWSYAVFLPLAQAVTADTTFVEIDLTMDKGMIGADILPEGGKNFVGSEVRARSYGKASQKIYVPVSFYDRPTLVLRNIAVGQSAAVIHSISLVQRRPAPAAP